MNTTPDATIELPSKPASQSCSGCGTSLDAGLRFCTACGAAVAQPSSTSSTTSSIHWTLRPVVEYVKSLKDLKKSWWRGLRAWFPFAWRTVVLTLPPLIIFAVVVLFTILLTGSIFKTMMEKSTSITFSEAEQIYNTGTDAAFEAMGRVGTPATVIFMFIATLFVFRTRGVRRALGETGNAHIGWFSALASWWSFQWRFWILAAPSLFAIWLLVFKPVVMFGKLTKGDEVLVNRIAENVSGVAFLAALIVISILPFCDSRFAKSKST